MKIGRLSCVLALLWMAASPAAWSQNYPPYIALASVDAGRIVEPRSPEALRTKAAFDRASSLCVAPNGLENQVSYIRNEILKQTTATSNVEILEGLAGILSGASKKPECVKILTMYAGLRTGNNPEMTTHTDVVIGMRGLARSGIFGFAVKGSDPKISTP